MDTENLIIYLKDRESRLVRLLEDIEKASFLDKSNYDIVSGRLREARFILKHVCVNGK